MVIEGLGTPVDAPVIPSAIELDKLVVVGTDTIVGVVPVEAPETPGI